MTDYHLDDVPALSQADINRYYSTIKRQRWWEDDYDESDEIIALRQEDDRNIAEYTRRQAVLVHMVHFISHKQFKRELIEALYHPDRYEKMVKTYGEVWADIHLP